MGWRLALADPAAVTAIITQNGNGYDAGFAEGFWKPVREYWAAQNPQTEAAVRQALTLEAIRWQFLHGVPDETLVSPDTWQHDYALVSRPGNDLVQLALFADYASNLLLYPKLHAWLRESRVPVLAIWGRNDEIFPESALAPAEGQTFCSYKGVCSYYDVAGARRAAWSYEDAWTEVRRVSGLVSFEPDKIEVSLDGRRLRLEPGQSVVQHDVDRDLTTGEIAPGRTP